VNDEKIVAVEPERVWVFQLTNLQFQIGDEKTELPLPEGAPAELKPGWLRNRIPIEVEGRAWDLIDRTVGQPPLPRAETDGNALLTGELRTRFNAGDTLEELESIVDGVCMLLSFAVCRDVAAVRSLCVANSQNIVSHKVRSTKVHLFSEGGSALIPNSHTGDLRSFVQQAYPIVKQNREWWMKTLDIFIQARTNSFLEVRSALFNVLLDRIANAHPENKKGGEIDSELDAILARKDFKAEISKLFSSVCGKWTDWHTERYITSYLTNCNRRPSFATAIQRVCGLNGLSEPRGSFLATRHKLLHEGELNPKDKNVVGYVYELDCLLARLLLRMLGYSGYYFAQFNGKELKLQDELANQDKNPKAQ
jgi:hypothetical protein